MITKTYSATGPSCRVTFEIPAHEADATSAALLGEWNDWNPTTHPMERREDGAFHLTVELPTGHRFRFRYLLDGQRWLNESHADGFEPNQYGTHDSLLALEARAVAEAAPKTTAVPAAPKPEKKAAKKPAPAPVAAKKPAAPRGAKAPVVKAPAAKVAPAKPAAPVKATKPAAPGKASKPARRPVAPKGK